MNIPDQIEKDFRSGWAGTADDWWAQHPQFTTINSIAPTFTRLKQLGRIEAVDTKVTRAGGKAKVYRWVSG